MYKKAAQFKIRFQTVKGQLAAEDLFDLTLTQLDACYKYYNKQAKASEEESLLNVKTKEDSIIELKVSILKDVVLTKQEASKAAKESLDKKQQKEKLLRLIEEKRESSLADKSEEELLEELKKLG